MEAFIINANYSVKMLQFLLFINRMLTSKNAWFELSIFILQTERRVWEWDRFHTLW